MIRVTGYNYPALFEAFETISHDSGGRAGHAWYGVPDEHFEHLDNFNRQLAALCDEDLQTFCIGEVSESEALAKLHGLEAVSDFLGLFFNGRWVTG